MTTASTSRRTLGAGLVLGAACLWATFGLFTRSLYDSGFTPLELASVRAFIGFLGAAVIGIARGPKRLAIPPRALLFFAIYGILGFALFEYVFFVVLSRTTVAVAVALLYTAPAFVLIFSRVVWREEVPRWKLLSLVMVLAGVALVTGAADLWVAGDDGDRVRVAPVVIALGLLSGVFYAAYTLMSKRASQEFDAVQSVFWCFLFAALAFMIIAPPFAVALRDPAHLPMLIALGIVPTLLPYGLFLLGMKYLRASTASMLTSVEPMVAAILAALLLGEQLTILRALGIVLIVGAAAVVSFSADRG